MTQLGPPIPKGDSFLNRLYGLLGNDRQRLEEFLTEVLAEILARLDEHDFVSVFSDFFLADPQAKEGRREWVSLMQNNPGSFTVASQHSILLPELGIRKRPDIVILKGETPVALVECKVGAGYTWSNIASDDGSEESIQQLAAYGQWLRARGAPEAALVLLTQYADPPDDFHSDRRFGVRLRSVRRWSDLRYFLKARYKTDPATKGEPALATHLIDFIEENDLMVADVQPSDFAAARLFLASDAYNRLLGCVQMASKEIRPFLKKRLGSLSFNQRPQVAYEEDNQDIYVADWCWNRAETYEIGWGFWFSADRSDLSTWAKNYTPTWTLTEAALVYVKFFRGSVLERPIPKNWTASKDIEEDNSPYALAPLPNFLGTSDSTKKLATWFELRAKEAVDVASRRR